MIADETAVACARSSGRWTADRTAADDGGVSRPADRVLCSEPACGPLQLHHLEGKTKICWVRCQQVMQPCVVAAIGSDWSRLIDGGCYNVWSRELGFASKAPS